LIRFLCSVLSTQLANLQRAGGDVDAVVHASAERLLAHTTACRESPVRCPYSPHRGRTGVPLSSRAHLLHRRLATHYLARHPRYPQGARDRRPCRGLEVLPVDVAPLSETARRIATAPGALVCPSIGRNATTAKNNRSRLRPGLARLAGQCSQGSSDHRPTPDEAGPNRLRPSFACLSG
jgi:ribosomal protein L34E